MTDTDWIIDPNDTDLRVKVIARCDHDRVPQPGLHDRARRPGLARLVALDRDADQRVWIDLGPAELAALRDQITALIGE